MLKLHAALSPLESTPEAVNAVVRELRTRLGSVDVAVVFFTADHSAHSQLLVKSLRQELSPRTLIGCSAEGVIGSGAEIERSPGIAVLAGEMPKIGIHPIHISSDQWRGVLGDADTLRSTLGCDDDTRAIIGFGDPWTTPLNQLMQSLDALAPQSPLIGGMASAARSRGQNVLICDDETFDEGFVGISLSGRIEVRTLVSQGARPIGEPMVITKGKENVIEQVGGKPAMQVLRDMFESLPDHDKELLQHGLLIGRAISEYRESFERGDFLVRNVTGADEKSGAIAITDLIRIGQTVQFHVRDAASADEDLKLMLERAAKDGPFDAGFLFSCNGRGARMFEAPNHDIAVTEQFLNQTTIAGFFAAGEIGPVSGKNFIHGHTASFALLRDKSVAG